MFKSDNSTRVLIGKNINRTASVQITDRGTTSTFLADGEILVLDENDAVLTPGDTYADTKSIRIVQGKGTGTKDVFKSSNKIDGAGVIRFEGASYSAKVEQVTYIGYNTVTTTGSIDAQPYTEYKLTIIYKHNKDIFSEQLLRRVFTYTTGASPTQQEIADEFVSQINNDDWDEVTALAVNSGTNYGIRLTGASEAFDFNNVGNFKYTMVSFEVGLSGFGTTTSTDPQTSVSRGVGTPESIAELEFFAEGFDGAINRVHHPAPAGYSDVNSSLTYDVVTIEHFMPSKTYAVSGAKPARASVVIALPVGAGQTTDLLAQLNPWMASLPSAFTAVAV